MDAGRKALRRAAAAGFAAAVALIALSGGFVVVSGLYDVSATKPHFRFVDWMIGFALHRSVQTHSMDVTPPDLSDPALARLGRYHFETGCAPCHAQPETSRSPVARGMLPAPPRLEGVREVWSTRELFWIVRHGLKFTGMPGWPGAGRDDEVWPVVAYLRSLPDTRADAAVMSGLGRQALSFPPSDEAPLRRCIACHGDARAPPVDAAVPTLQGQKEGYLRRALAEYREDQRQSGMMEPLAAALTAEQTATLARHYAAAARPAVPAVKDIDAGRVARGRDIFLHGSRRDDLPACRGCHQEGTSPQFPLLSGLSGRYVATQLALFRTGRRSQTTHGRIMAAIAVRLTPQQIADIVAYLDAEAARPASASAAQARGEGP